MAVGKERYTKNVVYVCISPSIREGYGYLYLLGEDGLMYYYEYALPENGEVRDLFAQEIMTHCALEDGKMRISFVYATNIIHTLSQVVNPYFIGMDAQLEPIESEDTEEADEEMPDGEEDFSFDGEEPEDDFTGDDFSGDDFAGDDFTDGGFPDDAGADDGDDSPWGRGGSFGGAVVTEDDPSIALAGTESVPHEAIGSVDQIADTPIPFDLWLFSIKNMGQNMAAAAETYERLSDEQKEALQQEYNATFGL